MKLLLILLSLFIFTSCIPLRIAPTIKDHKVMVAKKFKRNLPRDYAFVFKDSKDANEFYNFINTKYALNHQDVEWNVPITINNTEFFLSFYETEIPTKTINLIPIIINAKLEQNGDDPFLKDFEFSRIGNWYLVLTVSDSNMDDCLDPNHTSREKALKYLREIKTEYLNTQNYLEAWFKQ